MIALVFPGQGSQYVGMGKDLYEHFPKVREIFHQAENLTGIPVRRLAFEGPLEELTRTENLQVVITTFNIATLLVFKENLREKFKDLVAFTAGHSLGEFSALYASSVLSFEDTLRVVKRRGELMGMAAPEKPSGMYAIINLERAKLESLIERIEGLVIISNFNSPKQLVISGEEPALSQVVEEAKACGAKVVRLKVSAGFHSPLMSQAEQELAETLEKIPFRDPLIPIVCAVTAKVETSGENLKKLMKVQITSPVRWIEVVEYIYAQGVSTFVEIGPKQVLKGLISQILQERPFKVYNVENIATLQETIETLS